MHIEKDYEELLRSLNENDVKYCIVGAYAVAYHGKARYTKDLDIFVEASVENGKRLLRALDAFGFEGVGFL
jgi:predicted nucleotidyltransferase